MMLSVHQHGKIRRCHETRSIIITKYLLSPSSQGGVVSLEGLFLLQHGGRHQALPRAQLAALHVVDHAY